MGVEREIPATKWTKIVGERSEAKRCTIVGETIGTCAHLRAQAPMRIGCGRDTAHTTNAYTDKNRRRVPAAASERSAAISGWEEKGVGNKRRETRGDERLNNQSLLFFFVWQ